MQKLREKLKGGLEKLHQSSSSEHQQSFSTSSVSEQDVYRYRKHRGVNLGSWFVLERWITSAPFSHAHEPGQSDFDVARGGNAKEILENHWDTWITEEDFKWLSERGINAVRIPIGYYHICGVDASITNTTDFERFHYVYEGAWPRIINAIETAQRYGIGVLIDLHAAPGKQNPDSHSGTSSSTPSFFSSSSNRSHTIAILQILIKALKPTPDAHPNIIGIELLNEPQPPNDGVLKEWYSETIKVIRSLDSDIPIVLGDCWRTDSYADYIASNEKKHSGEGLTLLDHHLYRCFTSEDTKTPASEHSRSISSSEAFTAAVEKLNHSHAGIIVGEWSAALNPGSIVHSVPENDQKREFVEAQLRLFDRIGAGWFFWTYKKEGGRDTGWCFGDAVEAGVFPRRVGMKIGEGGRDDREMEKESRDARRDKLASDGLAAHTKYWDQYPGTYAHERYGEGFIKGWDDAYLFFLAFPHYNNQPFTSVSELGFKHAWASRRTKDPQGKTYWEFEHGFMQGVESATKDFERLWC